MKKVKVDKVGATLILTIEFILIFVLVIVFVNRREKK